MRHSRLNTKNDLDMERPIGETFEYEGKMLQVVEQAICKGCVFFNGGGVYCKNRRDEITGRCTYRKDNKSVIFQEVKQK